MRLSLLVGLLKRLCYSKPGLEPHKVLVKEAPCRAWQEWVDKLFIWKPLFKFIDYKSKNSLFMPQSDQFKTSHGATLVIINAKKGSTMYLQVMFGRWMHSSTTMKPFDVEWEKWSSICKPLLFKQPGFSGRWSSPCVSACLTALYHPEFEQVWTVMKRFFCSAFKGKRSQFSNCLNYFEKIVPERKKKKSVVQLPKL